MISFEKNSLLLPLILMLGSACSGASRDQARKNIEDENSLQSNSSTRIGGGGFSPSSTTSESDKTPDPKEGSTAHYAYMVRGCSPNGRGGTLNSLKIRPYHLTNRNSIFASGNDHYSVGNGHLPTMVSNWDKVTAVLYTVPMGEYNRPGDFLKFAVHPSHELGQQSVEQLKKGNILSYQLPQASAGVSYGILCLKGSACETLHHQINAKISENKSSTVLQKAIGPSDEIGAISRAFAKVFDDGMGNPKVIGGLYGVFIGTPKKKPTGKTWPTPLFPYRHYSSYINRIDVLMDTDTSQKHCDLVDNT